MPRNRVIVSPEARKDLRIIRKHSERQWGSRKAGAYIEAIWDSIESLEKHPEIGRVVSPDQPESRRLTVTPHIVYYRIRESGVEISRVLHERMDASTQLD
jgi:toxin ParE1/3/4